MRACPLIPCFILGPTVFATRRMSAPLLAVALRLIALVLAPAFKKTVPRFQE